MFIKRIIPIEGKFQFSQFRRRCAMPKRSAVPCVWVCSATGARAAGIAVFCTPGAGCTSGATCGTF